MAGHPSHTAVLDACVLYPIAIADSLMSLAAAGLYAASGRPGLNPNGSRTWNGTGPISRAGLRLAEI